MSKPHSFTSFLLTGAIAASLGAGLTHGQTPTPIPVKTTLGPSPADSIVVNTTLTKDKLWILSGFLVVKAGVTLTIQPGTTIQGDATTRGTLLVDRGGYLVAAGTKDEPITFKGPTDERGAWGGIVMLGKAVSNQGLNNQYEAMGWAKFGGNDQNDSSGVLTYVRLDGPGFPVAVDRELNGLTLCAVGRRTVVHHIQVHRGDDDGVEFFGGAVNTDHIVVTQETDDAFDTDHGYSGNSQYMIAIQRVEPPRIRPGGGVLPIETVGDNGVECGSSTSGNSPATHPNWKNVTIIDNGAAFGPFQAKEECGGVYEKMVLVTGGGHKDSSSVWAMNFLSDIVVNGISLPTPTLDFKDVFITGKWKQLYKFDNGTSDQIALATEILNAKIKNYPYATANSYGLNKDLSPSNSDIIAAKAGAIVDGDLWYQGWTFPGTVQFDLGDTPIPSNTGAPTVTLTRTPGDLNAPVTFTLSATASDADGIATLEILKGGTVLASSTTGSVSFEVFNAAAGSHTYTVRAQDKHSVNPLTATQNLVVVVANPAPTVNLIRTGANNLVAPAGFTLNATASDADGIANLEILLGNQVLGSNASGSFSVNITDLEAGSYTYSVRATDKNATDAKSSTQELLVVVQAPPPNQAPEVGLTRTGETLIAPAGFTLNATATDADGAIASLQILEGDAILGGSNTGSLSVNVSGKDAGTYTYTVKATDNHATNPKTVTQSLTVVVHETPPQENASAPTVTLTLGTAGTLIAPAGFTLIATAEDANGIDTLQILQGDEVVASGTSVSLVVPITDKAAGTYTYTARAKDKHATDPKVSTKELEVTVNPPEPNDAPSISLVRSGASDDLFAPASFTLHALAEDPNGIETLEILLNGVVVGTSTNGVLSVQVSGNAAGTYTYIARAKDKHATDPKVTSKELVVVIKPAISTAIGIPLRDLSGISISASRGPDLMLQSAGYGSVKVSVWSLSGHWIGAREVKLVQGQNVVSMGNLRGVHIVRLSNGQMSRSARVAFNAGN